MKWPIVAACVIGAFFGGWYSYEEYASKERVYVSALETIYVLGADTVQGDAAAFVLESTGRRLPKEMP